MSDIGTDIHIFGTWDLKIYEFKKWDALYCGLYSNKVPMSSLNSA